MPSTLLLQVLPLQNEQKIVWSLHNIMREDPLRCCALGITIENTYLTLWCSSHTFLAASDPVDFLTV